MKNGIDSKVIAITGASSGIGKATAELLASHGAKVVLGARRSDRLEKIAESIRQNGGASELLEIDVTNRKDLEKFTMLAVERYGRLDVMINNAGISQLSSMEELDVEGWEQMINVNLKGTLYGIAAALPHFIEQNSGHFINVLSTAGLVITPTMGVYAGTKNAIRTISEALRQESQGRWRVTGISPGFVATEFVSNIKNDAIREILQKNADDIAISATAIASAIAYAIEQPDNVDVGDIVIRPTVQG